MQTKPRTTNRTFNSLRPGVLNSCGSTSRNVTKRKVPPASPCSSPLVMSRPRLAGREEMARLAMEQLATNVEGDELIGELGVDRDRDFDAIGADGDGTISGPYLLEALHTTV